MCVCVCTCMILRMRVVFWKSYSRLKWIWPTFSVGSELSMYMSTSDMERFCQNAICQNETNIKRLSVLLQTITTIIIIIKGHYATYSWEQNNLISNNNKNTHTKTITRRAEWSSLPPPNDVSKVEFFLQGKQQILFRRYLTLMMVKCTFIRRVDASKETRIIDQVM